MLDRLKNRNRKMIEKLYEDKCTIFEKRKVKDPITKKTSLQDGEVLNNQPCRLSFKSITSTKENGTVAMVKQVVKLLISPEININPGSKIVVTHKGKTTDYKSSGKPAIYSAHQEIILELFEERA